MNACRVQNPWIAASLLRNGDCDIVSVCRQLIADPDWPNKIREKQLDDIIPCTGCAWCMGSFTCAVNPRSPFYKSKEAMQTLRTTAAPRKKRVIVVGGGLAGMEAAVTLAERGHSVRLYEKEQAPGRRLRVQGLAPFRQDMDVIVATGCRPALPVIPGIDRHPHVVFAEDVLLEAVDVGERVVVIDAEEKHDLAGLGSFAAQFAARAACLREDVAMHIMRWSPQHDAEAIKAMSNQPAGRQVTIVSRDERIADVYYHHYTTTGDLRRMGVRVLTGCAYKEITGAGVVVLKDGKEELIEADTIVTARYVSERGLYDELLGKVPELHLTGDAKAIQVQYVANVHGPYRLALEV
jgi:NADPH-dependent 2,4-dienoyl-CoA reductase/sulfur reductase-like enzyme